MILTLLPAFLMLPSIIVPTFSSFAISDTLLSLALYPMTDVLEITLNSGTLDTAEIISSVIPSAK